MAEQDALDMDTGPDKYEARVPDGTPLDEAVSALIKEIRRGKELEAFYWARQIEEKYWRYLWRRLLIACTEEVSMAAPQVLEQVLACAEAYAILKKESKAPQVDDGFILQATMVLCRAPKNREGQWLHHAYEWLTKAGWKAKVPEYAVDLHTARGKPKYRALTRQQREKWWWEKGCYVANEVGPYDWQLWWMRHMALEGTLPSEMVEAKALEWKAAGLLLHDPEGFPYPEPS